MAFIMCFTLFEVFFFVFDHQAVIPIRHSKVNELPLNSDDPGKYLFEIVPRKSKNNSTSISTCIKRSSTITAHVPKVAEGVGSNNKCKRLPFLHLLFQFCRVNCWERNVPLCVHGKLSTWHGGVGPGSAEGHRSSKWRFGKTSCSSRSWQQELLFQTVIAIILLFQCCRREVIKP